MYVSYPIFVSSGLTPKQCQLFAFLAHGMALIEKCALKRTRCALNRKYHVELRVKW